MGTYGAGQQPITAPTGAELVAVDGGGAVLASLTSGQISALSGGSGVPAKATPITTVGAGVLTAAALVGGVIVRTGPVAAYTDTTATAAQIVAAIPGAFVGQSFEVALKNGTAFAQTLSAGAGVTLPVAPATIIPANSVGVYLVTLTSLTAVTFTHLYTPLLADVTPAQFTTAALSVGTLAAGAITGAAFVVLTNTGATPGAQTTRTAAQMLSDFPAARVGLSYMLRIVNTGAGTLTLTADASVTINGTPTVAQNVFRDYVVTFTTATTATIQSVGSGVSP